MSALDLVPMTVQDALPFIDQHHRHHYAPESGLFAVGVEADGRLCCVALVGRPNGRGFNGRRIAQVSRAASDGSAPHAASKALAAVARGALALGYRRLVSYTLVGEAGTSYRAAGWWAVAFIKGREWDCPSRPRSAAVQSGDKIRWEFGPDAPPREPRDDSPEEAKRVEALRELDAFVREHVGRVAIPPRPPRGATPLFDAVGGAE